MKIIDVHCGEETDISDPRSYEHYERVVEIRPGKKNSGPYGPEIRKLSNFSIQHGVDKHLE